MAVLRDLDNSHVYECIVYNIRILVYAVYYCWDNYEVDCYMLLILVVCCMYVQCLFSSQPISIKQTTKDTNNNPYLIPPPQTIYSWLLHNISAKNVSPPISPFVFLFPLSNLPYTVCIVVWFTAASYDVDYCWDAILPRSTTAVLYARLLRQQHLVVFIIVAMTIASLQRRHGNWCNLHDAKSGWLLHVHININ